MSTITVSNATAASSQARSASRIAPVLRVGVVAGIVAASAATAVAVAAKAIDVPLRASSSNTGAVKAIPVLGFGELTLASTAVGLLVAVVLAKKARRPAPIFAGVAIVLTVLSFLGPITTHQATTATRVVLALTHVVAAVIVIPPLTRLLGRPSR
jgi:Family of unknown function (DUF6069)